MEESNLIRQLQLAELKTLKEAISFFDKNEIMYYAIGGTLLGAVRHHGFIPWDDDIDLGLPRESYDRLIRLHREGKCPLNIICPDNDDSCYWYPARIESGDLKVKRFVHQEITVQNVWLDLFPLDGLPDSDILKHLYWWKLSFRRFRFNLSRLQKYEPGDNKFLNVVKKLLVAIINPSKMDKRKEYVRYDRQMKKYGFKGRKWFLNAEGRCKMREIAPSEWLGTDCMIPFEDFEIRCIEGYDRYLTQIYGDYMKKPDDPSIYEHNILEIF